MKIICYVLAILGTLIGAFALLVAHDAATALAFAIVPYCLARAVDKLVTEASHD